LNVYYSSLTRVCYSSSIYVLYSACVFTVIFTLSLHDALPIYLMDASYEMLGMEPLPTWYYFYALAVGIIELVAGIMGVMYKSRKSVLIIGAVYCLGIVISLCVEAVLVGFTFLSLLSLILPILYMWGWYQSE